MVCQHAHHTGTLSKELTWKMWGGRTMLVGLECGIKAGYGPSTHPWRKAGQRNPGQKECVLSWGTKCGFLLLISPGNQFLAQWLPLDLSHIISVHKHTDIMWLQATRRFVQLRPMSPLSGAPYNELWTEGGTVLLCWSAPISAPSNVSNKGSVYICPIRSSLCFFGLFEWAVKIPGLDLLHYI